MSTPRLRLGQLLVDAKLVTAQALDEVLSTQPRDGRRLGTILVERGLINETQLTQILSHQLAVPWVSLLHIEFSRQLLNLVPHDVAERFCLVPIYVRHVRGQGNTLYVAMEDPTNEDGLKACQGHAGLPVRAMIAPPSDIRSVIRVYYGVASVEPPAVSVRSPAAVAPEVAPIVVVPATPAEPAPQPEVAPPVVIAAPEPAPEPPAPAEPEPTREAPPPEEATNDGPSIEAVEIALPERLRGVLGKQPTPPPPSEREVEAIPRPRGRAPRMVSLTLLDGTTINLPAKRARPAVAEEAAPAAEARPAATRSEVPGPEDIHGLTARDLVLALRVAAHGADASEVLGTNIRWESLFSALLAVLMKKHLIADWEFVDELKKQL